MIQLLFDFANEKILVEIDGNKVLFGHTGFGAQLADISGLQLSYHGVVREFPDLELRDDWKEESIKRFKGKIKECENEDAVAKYIISDLKGHGYIPQWKQKQGFRRERL